MKTIANYFIFINNIDITYLPNNFNNFYHPFRQLSKEIIQGTLSWGQIFDDSERILLHITKNEN